MAERVTPYKELSEELKKAFNTPFNSGSARETMERDQLFILELLSTREKEFTEFTKSKKRYLITIVLDKIENNLITRLDEYREPLITAANAKKIWTRANYPQSNEDTKGFLENAKFPYQMVVYIAAKEKDIVLIEDLINFQSGLDGQTYHNSQFWFLLIPRSRTYTMGNPFYYSSSAARDL